MLSPYLGQQIIYRGAFTWIGRLGLGMGVSHTPTRFVALAENAHRPVLDANEPPAHLALHKLRQ